MEKFNLKESQYARSLIEASLDPLVTISAEGKITDVNEASVNVTGIKRENLIGTDFSNYFTEPEKARVGYLQVFEKGFVADYPLTIKHTNGNLTDVLYNASVYKDINGNVLGVFATARDVTEQKWAIDLRIANRELAYQNDEKEKRAAELVIANKELAFQNDEKERRATELIVANNELLLQYNEKEKRSVELDNLNKELAYQTFEKEKHIAELVNANYARSLIEASRDPLFTISTEGKITDINEATIRATGKQREELIGTDFYDYFTEPNKAKEGYKAIFKKGFITDYPLIIKDHKLTDVLFNGSIYKNEQGNVLGAVLVTRDITDQKRIENELTEAKIYAELATVIAEDAKSKAESATYIAENAVKAKQQFLSNMSHEIRTPMNAIIGFTKVVLKTDLTAKQREYLTAIKMSGDALIVLINDILDLAKVDAGKMTFEQSPFKMALSISAMLHLFEPKIEEKNLQLIKVYDENIPEVLMGDSVRLHQIILNLVSNAVKFTNKGNITVSVKLVHEDNEKVSVEFAVKDTGIGISEKKIGRIFENFQQASSGTSRLYGGTGLGLAIVKQLVETQGGFMQVQSELDKGSQFSFVLSFGKTNAKAIIQNITNEINTEKKDIKILVVEDIALNQLLMKTLLDDFGFESDISANGKIAIEKLKTKTYDIILMDLQMPEMNGFEATEYIRSTLNSQIPIIALTADVTTVDLAKCKAVGMNDYIAKPVDEKLLYNKIMSFIKQKVENNTKIVDKEVHQNGNVKRCINLEYLNTRTKSNPALMTEMIKAYLDQTPPLIAEMKLSFESKNWELLYATIHKMMPSFSIMGINVNFENMAKKVQSYANTQLESESIDTLVSELEKVCIQACIELNEELLNYKIDKDE
jgi:PAS domain S-box-containing protein